MLIITVHGHPAPQGSKRHVGRGVMVESSKKVRPWREAVKHAALDQIEGPQPLPFTTITGPVHARIQFVFNKPKSAPKRRKAWPITRSTGDVDKLLRSTFDALTDAGVIRDDSQIVYVAAEKLYTDDDDTALSAPGAVIRLMEIDPPEATRGEH